MHTCCSELSNELFCFVLTRVEATHLISVQEYGLLAVKKHLNPELLSVNWDMLACTLYNIMTSPELYSQSAIEITISILALLLRSDCPEVSLFMVKMKPVIELRVQQATNKVYREEGRWLL